MSNTEIIQKTAQNIQKEIDMKSFIFYGKMRTWKTLNAIRLALDKRYNGRIYSNVDIYIKWKSILTKKITLFEELDKIRFSFDHGIILLDESWLNANSKDTHTLESRLLQKVLFLAGKKNCSVIWIAQRFESIDVNARVLADFIIEVKKTRRENIPHPLFLMTKQKMKFGRLEYVQTYINDTITEFYRHNVTYNTLEESIIQRKKKKYIKKE